MTNAPLFVLAMVAVFLIFNVMVSTVVEVWNTWHAKRGKFLWDGVRRMVGGCRDGHAIVNDLREHPAIEALEEDGRPASYIPSTTFATALVDAVMARNAGARLDKYGLPEAIALLPQELRLKRPLELALAAAKGEPASFVRNVARLYDDCMDRVSGRYKRDAQKRAVWFGLALAILLNFDAVHIATALWRDPATAQLVIDRGNAIGAGLNTPVPGGKPPPANDQAIPTLPQQLPIGWPPRWYVEVEKVEKDRQAGEIVWHLFATVLGMLIMGASCLLGAPMWFQILASLMPLRAAGRVPPRIEETKPPSGFAAGPVDPLPGAPPAAPATSPTGAQPWLNDLERSMLQKNDLKAVQKKLGAAPTGTFDAATRAAIRAFQKEQNYAETGQLTQLLLLKLGFADREG